MQFNSSRDSAWMFCGMDEILNRRRVIFRCYSSGKWDILKGALVSHNNSTLTGEVGASRTFLDRHNQGHLYS